MNFEFQSSFTQISFLTSNAMTIFYKEQWVTLHIYILSKYSLNSSRAGTWSRCYHQLSEQTFHEVNQFIQAENWTRVSRWQIDYLSTFINFPLRFFKTGCPSWVKWAKQLRFMLILEFNQFIISEIWTTVCMLVTNWLALDFH